MRNLLPESPIVQLRKKNKLSQRQFALLMGKSSGHMSDVEYGCVDLSDDILDSLDELGIDADALADDHREYMALRVEALRTMFIKGDHE